MNPPETYIIDADVFITAKNGYYAFEICPGFWASLIHHHQTGTVHSIDQIKNEILRGRPTEDLVQWVKRELPGEFFHPTDDEAVIDAFEEVMLWAQRNAQFTDPAKAKFATEADGWLVAYAVAHGGIVVTNEQPRPDAKNRILLPDVCDQFDVNYQHTFTMLKDLAIRFDWAGAD